MKANSRNLRNIHVQPANYKHFTVGSSDEIRERICLAMITIDEVLEAMTTPRPMSVPGAVPAFIFSSFDSEVTIAESSSVFAPSTLTTTGLSSVHPPPALRVTFALSSKAPTVSPQGTCITLPSHQNPLSFPYTPPHPVGHHVSHQPLRYPIPSHRLVACHYWHSCVTSCCLRKMFLTDNTSFSLRLNVSFTWKQWKQARKRFHFENVIQSGNF